MRLDLLIEGILIGFVVAVPVGPLGLLCFNRALMMGPLCGLFSGFGVATADALAAGIVALGMTLIAGFLVDHQLLIRLVAGCALFYLGIKIYRTRPLIQPPPTGVNGVLGAYATTFLVAFSNPATTLSFVAIYAGWQVQSLHGNYSGAAALTIGVFIGSWCIKGIPGCQNPQRNSPNNFTSAALSSFPACYLARRPWSTAEKF